jgi:hypothetical protein
VPSPLTLEDAVKYALARQSSSRAARAIEAAEEAGLEYARTNYLPNEISPRRRGERRPTMCRDSFY